MAVDSFGVRLDWGNITREEASQNTMTTYLASKIFAEQEAWKFAEAHPELDVATSRWQSIYLIVLLLTF